MIKNNTPIWMELKIFPSGKNTPRNITSDQEQKIKEYISEKLEKIGNDEFVRGVIFSPNNQINWYWAAFNFCQAYPNYKNDLFDIVYPPLKIKQ